MRIVHFAPRFLPIGPDAVVGGSNNGLWNLAIGLRRHAPAVRQVLVAATNDAGAGWMDALEAGFDAVRWRRLPHDLGPLAYGARAASALLGALVAAVRAERPDVLHGHSGYPHYAALTGLVGRLTGTPVVHSLYCPVEAEVHDRRRLVAHPALARTLLSGARHLLPMSGNVDRSLAALGVPAERRTVVRPGLRPSVWEGLPTRAQCRERFGVGPDERLVLFVGNPSWAKGVDLLLDAAERVFPARPGVRLDCTFELAYRARQGHEEAVRQRVQASPVRGRIRFHGLLENIRVLMRAADVAVFPFRNTSGPSDLPVALMECMAVGTPVLASDLPGNAELVGADGTAGLLFPAGDAAALATGLVQVLDAPPAGRDALGAAGAQRIRTEFALETAAAQALAIYGSLAPGGR